VFGEGPLDLLFVGGFVSHLELMFDVARARRFIDRLASFARVIVFDKRGQGLSDPGAYTVENICADALAVLDTEGIDRVSIFGVSEGGSASTMLAATHPDRVEAMVQFATYARMSRAPDYPEGIRVERLRETWAQTLEQWATGETLAQWAPSLAGDPEYQRWWRRLVRNGASPAAARTLGAMYEELDVRPLLPLVRVPTLVIWREGDPLVPARLSRTVADGIPGAVGKELPGGDHLFVAGDIDAMLDEAEEFLTGRPPAAPVERVLSTVMFTDLVDSTRHAAELGDRRWRATMDELDGRWRRLLESQRGRFIKSTGDGLLATFDGPARAARAALGAHESAGALGLEARSGIHTGECELRGEDVSGIAVNIAARVEAAARDGEVTTTGTVKDLVIGSGLEFVDRGQHTLKGVPGEWRLFAVSDNAGSL
jgi:pimeloyl-ACP methyl ester carboxylesterase